MPFGSIQSGPLFKNTKTNYISLGIYKDNKDEYLRIELLELMDYGMNCIQFPNQLNGAQIYLQIILSHIYHLTSHLEKANGGASVWFWLYVPFWFWILYYSLTRCINTGPCSILSSADSGWI